jgi:hypothetical protein
LETTAFLLLNGFHEIADDIGAGNNHGRPLSIACSMCSGVMLLILMPERSCSIRFKRSAGVIFVGINVFSRFAVDASFMQFGCGF